VDKLSGIADQQHIRQLPDRYEKDILQLMVRDATSLYVYWEVSNRKRWLVAQHFQCDWGFMPRVLRVYDVSCIYFNGYNANAYWDIETTAEASNWYIFGLTPGATFVVDLGIYNITRQFIPLIRSNAVSTPRAQPALWGEPIVGVVEQAQQALVKQRIDPQFMENFSPCAAINSTIQLQAIGGSKSDDSSFRGPFPGQRLLSNDPACSSALYPPS
jgi:hypothetical protein